MGTNENKTPAWTPGLWEVETDDPHRLGQITSDDGTLVAEVFGDWDDGSAVEANAHLIAAAPELYAACQLALELFEGEDPASSADSYAAAYAARIEHREQIEQSIRLALSRARGGVADVNGGA